ncbi:Uncharacterised protein [Bordetella pertussis]|nr:Uncharacterised protein [Bordetella pertussis]
MPAIWNSYSKSDTARRPRMMTRPFWSRTKSFSKPPKLCTSTLG